MKAIFISLVIFASTISQAQTKRIAHKSHSGSEANFIAAHYIGNLGLPSYSIDSIRKINDTTLLEYCSRFPGQTAKKDTINYNKELYILDSVERKSDSLIIFHRREFMTLKKEIDTVNKNSYNSRLGKRSYPGYHKRVKRINFEENINIKDSDSIINKQLIPVIPNDVSNKNNKKNYNKNALKNFMLGSFFLMMAAILSVFVIKKKKYAYTK